ncbi:glycoside hydrolase family 43 protein [Paenibacillus ferrarius]|uniref:glycoside hydrolase family 43 protein n=1 Tax=Paenibacillus ferrarius TaxID=1469647 RepID=UPI003D2DA5B0
MAYEPLMEQKNTGYLFVYFTGEDESGEQVYFALSEDGLHWHDLNRGKPVLTSRIGERGVRDPFILRSSHDGNFYIIATDLRIASGKGWDAAQHRGSRSIVVWEATDLTHWSEERSIEMDLPEAGCVWAPETIYDADSQEHLMFWASMTPSEGKAPKQIIYSSRTRDFRTFTRPEVFIERDNHVIDTSIIRAGERYYRFSKDETTKCILLEQGDSLAASSFADIVSADLDHLLGVEGPAVFKFNDRDEWCLLVDQFMTNQGYLPMVTDDLASGRFRVLSKEEYAMGATKKRHGSVLNLTAAEYAALKKAWG